MFYLIRQPATNVKVNKIEAVSTSLFYTTEVYCRTQACKVANIVFS